MGNAESFENMQEQGFIISLNDDLYKKALNKLSRKSSLIKYSKFDAIKGRDLDINDNNLTIRAKYGLLQPYRQLHSDLGSMNAVGCYLSHKTLWDYIVDNDLAGIYIFESDAICQKDFDKHLRKFKEIPNAHILLLGYIGLPDILNIPSTVGINKLNTRFFGTHSYYITLEGAKYCLKNINPIEQQIDSYLSDLIVLSQKVYLNHLIYIQLIVPYVYKLMKM